MSPDPVEQQLEASVNEAVNCALILAAVAIFSFTGWSLFLFGVGYCSWTAIKYFIVKQANR